ncbi:MAG: cytochrome c3 family protein [Planctomycetota bacterium]
MNLTVKIFGLAVLALGAAVVVGSSNVRLPGNQIGYEPLQPIAYSHRLHAGDLGMPCLYCHYGAATSRQAGIPPASLCMNCHAFVTAGKDAQLEEEALAQAENREPRKLVSPELQKLYDALGLDERLVRDPRKPLQTIAWERVHDLQDFVAFDHRPHVARGIACESCHGPVQTMERVRQFSDLSMGWCVQCHRDNARDPDSAGTVTAGGAPQLHHVSTDCAACHY